MAGEFDLIQRYFSELTAQRSDVSLAIGDDCALLTPPADQSIAVSCDTLVSGRHFFPEVDPESLGHKALAVNLSDLAAMGATPAWITLALTLPNIDPAWLGAFAGGLKQLADRHQVQLIGGDTTQGPLTISIQAMGLVDNKLALRRSGARPGDLVYVSGWLGDAGLVLQQLQRKATIDQTVLPLRDRLERPEPRVALGQALRGIASSCIDLSDGLSGDLAHICQASSVAAAIDLAQLPLSQPVRDYVNQTGDWSLPLSSGDDYELCFSIPPEHQAKLADLTQGSGVPLTQIGRINVGGGLSFRLQNGQLYDRPMNAFEHFRPST